MLYVVKYRVRSPGKGEEKVICGQQVTWKRHFRNIRLVRKHNIAAYSICLSQSNFKISIRGRIIVIATLPHIFPFPQLHLDPTSASLNTSETSLASLSLSLSLPRPGSTCISLQRPVTTSSFPAVYNRLRFVDTSPTVFPRNH